MEAEIIMAVDDLLDLGKRAPLNGPQASSGSLSAFVEDRWSWSNLGCSGGDDLGNADDGGCSLRC